jgi:hypothetical protein
MRILKRSVYPAIAVGAAMVTVLGISAPALATTATTLRGDWAPFTRCPVGNASMLAADGDNVVAGCLATDSPSGSAKLGNSTLVTGDSNLQLGALINTSTGSQTAVAPSGGAITGAPVQVPGGLLGLMCPSNIPVISQLCSEITNSTLNQVTATIEAAGTPSGLNTSNAFIPGATVITLPVKIQLSNPLLGTNCFIGSNSHPIVLHPKTLVVPPNSSSESFDPNGTPDPKGSMLLITLSGGVLADSTFAVPGASGCGGLLAPVVDPVLDLKEGLPSASGNNSLQLDNVTLSIAGFADPTSVAPHEGQALSKAWNSAVTG